MAIMKTPVLLLCALVVLSGCVAARELQQAGTPPQAPLDLNNLASQVGQGLQGILQQGGQQGGAAGGAPAPAGGQQGPLAGLGNVLSNLGTTISNATRPAPNGMMPGAGGGGIQPQPAGKPASGAAAGAPPPADDSMLADPTEITAATAPNKTATTTGSSAPGAPSPNTTGIVAPGLLPKADAVTPPPGMGGKKSGAVAAGGKSVAALAAAAAVFVQLLA